eukprot:3416232-Prymnesium_polylepis.1
MAIHASHAPRNRQRHSARRAAVGAHLERQLVGDHADKRARQRERPPRVPVVEEDGLEHSESAAEPQARAHDECEVLVAAPLEEAHETAGVRLEPRRHQVAQREDRVGVGLHVAHKVCDEAAPLREHRR